MVMSAPENQSTCHPAVWKRLMALYAARATAKNRVSDLIKTRKALDEKLNELGAGSSPKHLLVSREFVVTIRSIERERARIQELADKAEATVGAGIQGVFDFPEDEEIDYKPFDEGDLFRHGAAKDDGDGGEGGEEGEGEEKPSPTAARSERPVGRIGPAKAPADKPVDEGYLATKLDDLAVSDRAVAVLKRQGWVTIGDLKRGHKERLTLISGITPRDESDIEEAIDKAEERAKGGPAAPADAAAGEGWAATDGVLKFPGSFWLRNISRPQSATKVTAGDITALEGHISHALSGAAFKLGPNAQVLVKEKPVLAIERAVDEAGDKGDASKKSKPRKKTAKAK